MVKILLEAGADVEHQNENGHTPLMEAASCGHVGKRGVDPVIIVGVMFVVKLFLVSLNIESL